MNITGPVQLDEGLWWVGDGSRHYKLNCNPYLYIDGSSAVLFDPGSVLDIHEVMENVRKIIPIYELDAVVASHQDPDLCSGIPLLEQNGFSGVICCHERASHLIRFYHVKSEFYIADAHKYRYQLKDGSYIKFLFAPYLHFPGAIMTMLPKLKTLISGDLFGAFTDSWTLHAHENSDYIELMKTFHESYMPSHDILKSVMDQLLFLDITRICPQHGSVISRDVDHHIEVLRDLVCGRLLQPVHRDLLEEGGYISLCSKALKRYIALYGKREVRQALKGAPFTVDYTAKEVTGSSLPDHLIWDEFFSQILKNKGVSWITILSSFIETLSLGYHIPQPEAFNSVIFDVHKDKDLLKQQYQELENTKIELEGKLKSLEDNLSRCPVTDLYNQSFFDLFLSNEMKQHHLSSFPFALAVIAIDNLASINLEYGSDEGDASMKSLSYILRQHVRETEEIFRLEGGLFALFMKDIHKPDAVLRVSALKNLVSESSMFIVSTSVSIGLFHSQDIPKDFSSKKGDLSQLAVQTAKFRLKTARKGGVNSLTYESETETAPQGAYMVLLADIPGMQRELIRKALEQEQYQVTVASDGQEAKAVLETEQPDIIVCELMLPKLSAFSLRKWQLGSPEKRKIPFIMVSSNKNESTVSRAVGLRITHFLQRPVLLAELLGIIGLITARLQIAEG